MDHGSRRAELIFPAGWCAALALAGPAILTSGVAPDSAWTAVDCAAFALEGAPEHVDCGYARVPRQHAEPQGPALELATVVIRSTVATPRPDPLFIAQGGPGGSTIDTYAEWLIAEGPDRITPERDLVLWDQRGTLWSRPALMCPEVDAAVLAASLASAPREDGEMETLAARACGERLVREHGDLSDFNTVENANDIAALSRVLGYGQINFYGVSYGTELGQYLIRQHPERLRSVVLDAVVPTTFNLVTEVAFVQQRIAEKYLEGCAQQAACGAAYPDLAARFQAMLDRLDAEPAIVEVTDPRSDMSASHRIRITGEDLADLLYQALYSRDFHAVVPLLIDRATRGDIEFLGQTLLPVVLFDDSFALGMQIAVICAERGDTRLEDANYGGINPRIARSERESGRMLLESCRSWGISLLPREVLAPVTSDVPVLMLSGNFDPITPPAFATRVGESLSADFNVVFPRGAHGQAFTDACANSVIESFLDSPDIPPPVGCAREAPSDYLIPQDLILLPALRAVIAAPEPERLARTAAFSVPILLGMLTLATALCVYPVGWLVDRIRRTHHRTTRRAGGWLDRHAARIAVAAFVLFSAFLWLLAQAVGDSIFVSPALLYLAAIRSEHAWIFALAVAGLGAAALMVAAAAAVWTGDHRSLAGRVYYSLLVIAAIAIALGLSRAGLVWPTEFV